MCIPTRRPSDFPAPDGHRLGVNDSSSLSACEFTEVLGLLSPLLHFTPARCTNRARISIVV